MSDNTAAVARLQRVFGNVDKDVLLAVLEVCGGDHKAAEKYLQATDGGGYDARTLSTVEGGIPKDYPGQSKAPNPFSSYKPSMPSSSPNVNVNTIQEDQIKALFLNDNITYQEHYDAQMKAYDVYVSVLLLLISQGVEVSKASRPRILASCWARKEHALPEYLLTKEDLFNLPHVLGALNLLDAARKVRAIEKKIARLQKQGTVKPKKLGQFRSTINDLKREAHIGSVSGALSKHITKWVQSIPAWKLEFYALNMPRDPWVELADIVHLNPNDFQCKWFLEYVFGKEAPKESIMEIAGTLSPDTVMQLLAKHEIPYSYLRLHVKPIPEEAKSVIAKYSPLDTVIWYYEELASPDVDKIIETRLDKEQPTFGYGKLMERMLYFKSVNSRFYPKLMPIAESRLNQIDLQLESPVSCIGDASYSMDVAIRVSTVIASVLTALCGAELKFFTGESVDPPIIPRNVQQVLDVATAVKADGLTAPAAALYPYYTQKKVVKFFIIVTDEIENEKYKGQFFPALFLKYHQEVYPAKIVFVSFMENPSEKGRMVTALENMGITPLQFKLDGKRPDLSKLDSLLGLLASESTYFPKQVHELVQLYNQGGGIQAVLKRLLTPREPKPAPLSTPSDSNNNNNNNNNSKNFMTPSAFAPPVKQENTDKTDPTVEIATKSFENLDLQSKECVICEERPVDTALLECGHLNFCATCAESLKECPICRQKVIRAVRIYQH